MGGTLPTVAVHELALPPTSGELVAATHGRSLWTSDVTALRQIKPEHLEAHLAKGLKPLYTLHGDEPLLAQEAGDAIRAAARASGFSERKVFTVGNAAHFDWAGFIGASQAMSLFAERQLI